MEEQVIPSFLLNAGLYVLIVSGPGIILLNLLMLSSFWYDKIQRARAIKGLNLWSVDSTLYDGVGGVYFLQGPEEGPIKIGHSDNVGRRMAEIQRMSPVALSVLAIVDDAGQGTETRLHRQFAQSRMYGEWFAPTPDLLDVILEVRCGLEV